MRAYDPGNLAIVSCGQADWDLARAVVSRPGISRLGRYCKSLQGEVNETNEGARAGVVNARPAPGRVLALRGSNICRYVLRTASQDERRYIDVAAFRRGKGLDTKAFHGERERVGFQRSAPQNNYRRLIAAYIPPSELCFDTVSYVPAGLRTTRLSMDPLLALLNSKLLEWCFRLGSTNSKVNEYQFENLPCPVFRDDATAAELDAEARIRRRLEEGRPDVRDLLPDCAGGGPFGRAARTAFEGLA